MPLPLFLATHATAFSCCFDAGASPIIMLKIRRYFFFLLMLLTLAV